MSVRQGLQKSTAHLSSAGAKPHFLTLFRPSGKLLELIPHYLKSAFKLSDLLSNVDFEILGIGPKRDF